MARYFLDSSALIKRYHRESGSPRIKSLFDSADDQRLVSRLALLEVHSALARLVREADLSLVDFNRLIRSMRADSASNVIRVSALNHRRLDEAARVITMHGVAGNLRTLDAIHLATAMSLHTREPLTAFVAGDKKILEMANRLGFVTMDVSS